MNNNDNFSQDELKIEYVLEHGNTRQIIGAINSAARYVDEPNYVFDICKRFYSHKDKDVRKAVLFVLSIMAIKFKKVKFDLDWVVKILKYSFECGDKEAAATFGSIYYKLSKKQKFWIREQLQEFYDKFKLYEYDNFSD